MVTRRIPTLERRRQLIEQRRAQSESVIAKREFLQQQKELEKQQAMTNPERANPQLKNKLLIEAKTSLQKEIDLNQNKIDEYNKKIQEKRDRLAKGGLREKDKKSIRQSIEDYEDQRYQFEKKNSILNSYIKADENTLIRSFFSGEAKGRAQQAQDRIASSQKFQEIRKEDIERLQNKWIEEGEKRGLKPIFDKSGMVKGFEDKNLGMSYSLDYLGLKRPEATKEFEKKGLLEKAKFTQEEVNKIQSGLTPSDKVLYNQDTGEIEGIYNRNLDKKYEYTPKGLSDYEKDINKILPFAYVQGFTNIDKDKREQKKLEDRMNRLDNRLADFYSKIGLIDKDKYMSFKNNVVKKAEEFEKSKLHRNYKKFYDNLTDFSNTLFIDIPVALTKLSFNIGKSTGDTTRKTIQNPINSLSSSLNFVKNSLNNAYKKVDSMKELQELIINGWLMVKNVSKPTRELIMKIIKSQKNPKQVLIFISNLEKGKNLQNLLEKSSDFVIKSGFTFLTLSYQNIINIPAGFLEIIENPSYIKKILKEIIIDYNKTVELLMTDPSSGIAKIGSDYLTFYVVGKSLKFTGKYTKIATNRMNPYFKSFSKGKRGILTINAPEEMFIRRGKNVYLQRRVPIKRSLADKIKGRKPGQFVKFQKSRGLKLRKGVVNETGKPLSEQVKYGGKNIGDLDAPLVSVQAEKLIDFFKNQKIVKKPIPKEEFLTKETKKLLKKFDEGKISKKEFVELNKRLIKETGNKTILERSTYFSPGGIVRFTRLNGDIAEASLRDIFKGNFTFKKTKPPQILVINEGKIASYPKKLMKIIKKLEKGKNISEKERLMLVDWQVTPSGNVKPIGDVRYKGGIELEVTAAPKDAIRRVKLLATTEINGIFMQIVEVKIIKLSKKTISLLERAKKGVISLKEAKLLKKLLKKETKYDSKVKDLMSLSKRLKNRRATQITPYFPIKRKIASRLIRRRKKVVKRPTRTTKRPTRSPRRPSRTTRSPRRVKRPPKRPKRPTRSPRRPSRTTRSPRRVKKTIKIIVPKGFKKKKLKKTEKTYYVVVKRRGKIIALNPRPLILKDAKDFLAYKIDNNLGRSAWFEPYGTTKNVISLPPNMKGYFNKVSKKLRPYKIRVGRKKAIRRGYIEKNKYISDTKGEKKELKQSRIKSRIKKRKITKKPIKITKRPKKIVKRVKKRKITPSQRKELLKRLEKARKVRMKKLKTKSKRR